MIVMIFLKGLVIITSFVFGVLVGQVWTTNYIHKLYEWRNKK